MRELERVELKITILIVDDTESNIDMLLDLLGDLYDVRVALSGESALQIVQTEPPELILLDIMMPKMDGYEVCRVLKADEKTKDIPVVFITAKTDEESIGEAYEAGGIDYITKPFKPKELFARVDTQVRLIKLLKDLQSSQTELREFNEILEERVKVEVEKNQIQNQKMLHQSRLAQMGEMISMIAHQWRQPLNSISLTSSNLQLKLMMGEVNHDFFTQEMKLIDEYSQHLSKTIDDFRNFFRENKNRETTTLEQIVKATLEIVKVSLEHKCIKIVTDFNCHVELQTYPNEVKHVLLNIIKNAEDVLLENRVNSPLISIETLFDVDSKNRQLIIRDNAGGIPHAILEKVFDPYFSTKLEKDGTGLGLYMSKTIIEEHCDGKLSVLNDKDGAVFIIEFPLSDKERLNK